MRGRKVTTETPDGWVWSWVILDTKKSYRPYIAIRFDTRAEAEVAKSELLRGYPRGHVWRSRLIVDWRAYPEVEFVDCRDSEDDETKDEEE